MYGTVGTRKQTYRPIGQRIGQHISCRITIPCRRRPPGARSRRSHLRDLRRPGRVPARSPLDRTTPARASIFDRPTMAAISRWDRPAPYPSTTSVRYPQHPSPRPDPGLYPSQPLTTYPCPRSPVLRSTPDRGPCLCVYVYALGCSQADIPTQTQTQTHTTNTHHKHSPQTLTTNAHHKHYRVPRPPWLAPLTTRPQQRRSKAPVGVRAPASRSCPPRATAP